MLFHQMLTRLLLEREWIFENPATDHDTIDATLLDELESPFDGRGRRRLSK